MSTKRPKAVPRAALATLESKNIVHGLKSKNIVHGQKNLYKLTNDCSLIKFKMYIKRNKMLHAKMKEKLCNV